MQKPVVASAAKQSRASENTLACAGLLRHFVPRNDGLFNFDITLMAAAFFIIHKNALLSALF